MHLPSLRTHAKNLEAQARFLSKVPVHNYSYHEANRMRASLLISVLDEAFGVMKEAAQDAYPETFVLSWMAHMFIGQKARAALVETRDDFLSRELYQALLDAEAWLDDGTFARVRANMFPQTREHASMLRNLLTQLRSSLIVT